MAGCSGMHWKRRIKRKCSRIAFSVKDDYASFDENPQKLAELFERSHTNGKNVELYPITSDSLALEATLRFG